ncbi:MAG: sensor histidine kinase [Solirubrobacteraceae bacterium]
MTEPTAPAGPRAVRQLAYVIIGLPLGLAYLALIAAAVVCAVVFGPVWVGLPPLLAAAGVAWRCAALERTLANRLLHARIPPLAPPRAAAGSIWPRVRGRLRGAPFWRSVALLALKLPAHLIVAAVTGAGMLLAGGLLVIGVEGVAGADRGFVGPFSLDSWSGIALCALAAPVGVVTLAAIDGLTGALRALARALLATRIAPGDPVRQTLAESLGDRTLTIAYWLADRNAYVDEHGLPVSLPEPGSDRAWTAVDYGGRRVAAIVHDADLDASPELISAAAAGASLAIDNDRLKADLRARVEELRASRVRIVEAADAARRRLERDLHDGAQQQLVALAIDLRILRSRLEPEGKAAELIDGIDEKLATALAELRELARGIHPAILTDRGLEPALDALAARAPLPVRCRVELTGRPPPPVEAAAYFVVAEALTNVLKYAGAERATVHAFQEDGHVVVEVSDDGGGGADPQRGSGLRGLGDRLGALDGTLTVESPPGEGTLVRARIPWPTGRDDPPV